MPVNNNFREFVVPPPNQTGWTHGQTVTASQVRALFQNLNAGRRKKEQFLAPRLNFAEYHYTSQSFATSPGTSVRPYYFIRPTSSAIRRAASGRDQTIIQGHPRGFKSRQQFEQSMRELIQAARKDGLSMYSKTAGFQPLSPGFSATISYPGFAGIRGSSVTGRSAHKGTTFNERPYNGRKASDIDVFVVSPSVGYLRALKPGFAGRGKYVNLSNWSRKWQSKIGREMSVRVRAGTTRNDIVSSIDPVYMEPFVRIQKNGTLGDFHLPSGW